MYTESNILENNSLTIAQLAVSKPGALAVFTKYNIDYCCGGHRSFEDACLRAGLDPEKIMKEIRQSSGSELPQVFRPDEWSSVFLIDFIIQNHHSYVKRAIPELQSFLDKVCDAHGNESHELITIRTTFADLAEELTSHMENEELLLFPAIKRFEARRNEDSKLEGTLHLPISAREHEHVIAGDLIKKIRLLSNNYTPPEFACPTFIITYQKLQEFDHDLMHHIHLENNILFERVKEKKFQISCSL